MIVSEALSSLLHDRSAKLGESIPQAQATLDRFFPGEAWAMEAHEKIGAYLAQLQGAANSAIGQEIDDGLIAQLKDLSLFNGITRQASSLMSEVTERVSAKPENYGINDPNFTSARAGGVVRHELMQPLSRIRDDVDFLIALMPKDWTGREQGRGSELSDPEAKR